MPRRHPQLPPRLIARRKFIQAATAGTVITALGGLYQIASRAQTVEAESQIRPDGRLRLPPGQKLIEQLRPMGGSAGDPDPAALQLSISGEVTTPLTLTFAELLDLPQTQQTSDVHCVTGWSAFDTTFAGVQLSVLAEKAGVKDSAQYVIFDAAHDHTTNIPIAEALAENVLIAHQMNGQPLRREHGAPVRSLIPDLYFWKSNKWLTGIRFLAQDEPGYWERRGYHNHGDPWKEERFGFGRTSIED